MTKFNAMPKRLEECHRLARRCDVPRCDRPRQKVGRFCEYHDLRCQQTGHPEGRVILLKDLRPRIKEAIRYLKKHQDLPTIANAIGWIERLIYQGGSVPLPEVYANSSADTRLLRWLVLMKRRELAPLDALALVVAIFTHREFSPRAFRDDRHFTHALAIRFLRQVPGHKGRSRRGRERLSYDRVTVGVRELLGPSIIANVGAVALAIGKDFVRRYDERNPARHLQSIL